MIRALVLGAALGGAALAVVAAPAQEHDGPLRSGSVAAALHVPAARRGFDVRLAPALAPGGDEEALGVLVLDALDRDLGDLAEALPAPAVEALRRTPLFVGVADPVAACACYHPSAEWLRGNGYDPAKARSVEIANSRTFLDWRRGQPSMVLHELAHAYLDRERRDAVPPLQRALAAMRARGAYGRVLRGAGQVDRHYALTDHHEYFAETTEALFGVNDFYPFVRAELLAVDPEGAALVAEIWGAPAPAPRDRDPEDVFADEVRDLHAFFDAWFAGRVEETDDAFERFGGAMDDAFTITVPGGATLDRSAILGAVRGRHGTRPEGLTRADVIDVQRIGATHGLVRYRETQSDGETTTTLASSALLALDPRAPGGAVWLHVHETRVE
ncbi:MAG: hypothetical protein AAGB93_09920 [Planctomycetota bacterium]